MLEASADGLGCKAGYHQLEWLECPGVRKEEPDNIRKMIDSADMQCLLSTTPSISSSPLVGEVPVL